MCWSQSSTAHHVSSMAQLKQNPAETVKQKFLKKKQTLEFPSGPVVRTLLGGLGFDL